MKLCLLVVASGLGLLALAALIVLANAVALVITLAIVGTVIFWLEDVPSSVELRWRPGDVQAASSLL